MGSRSVVATACVVLWVALWAASAYGAFPGQNGKLAFVGGCAGVCLTNPDGSGEISVGPAGSVFPAWSPDGSKLAVSDPNADVAVAVMNADGTGYTAIASSISFFDGAPTWSPDGTRLAFIRDTSGDDPAIWTIDADGTDASELFNPATGAGSPGSPAWSPDGAKIAFTMQSDIWTVNQDGTGATQVTDAPGPPASGDFEPSWSPDGTRIAFRSSKDGNPEIYTVDEDGSNPQRLTVTTHAERGPAWSPDGTRIAFQRVTVTSPCGPCPTDIWVMDSDGSDATNVTNDTAEESTPDWQPIPVNAYPRPKGAAPVAVSLVPAFAQCPSPNRQHGPPLAFGSCHPPVQTSTQLTVGTPDANGQPARSVGDARINPILGNPATPADEADVRLRADITDVRLASDLSDYAGALEARVTLRITDRDNTPHPGGPGAATVQDFTYSFAVPCAATADSGVGATCTLDTTVDAVAPGTVREGRRAIWQLGAVSVHDGAGAPFMKQGVFIP